MPYYWINPALSYDASYNGMVVGWNCDYEGDPLDYHPNSILAVVCNLDGSINSSCYNSGIGFMIVPYFNPSSNPYTHTYSEVCLSVAGRDYPQMEYTFYDYITSTGIDYVAFKSVYYCDTKYALRYRTQLKKKDAIISPNPFHDQLKINIGKQSIENIMLRVQISDIMGNVLFNTSGNEEKINKELKNESCKLENGMYIIQIEQDNSKTIIDRIIKM
jgi:hypothetical protein